MATNLSQQGLIKIRQLKKTSSSPSLITFHKTEQAEKGEHKKEKLKEDIKKLATELKEASAEKTDDAKQRIQSKTKLLKALKKNGAQSNNPT